MEQDKKISVLMSIYYKETPKNLDECLNSILLQTLQPDELIIVIDGEIGQELHDVLEKYRVKINGLKTYQLETNMGLGKALNFGMSKCKNNIIARMDTDDICVENRFELQVERFIKNSDLQLIGGQIEEFSDDNPDEKIKREVPLTFEEIVKFSKTRNPFNHVTIMFKKDCVIRVGGYEHMAGHEDYYLWLRMINNGVKCENMPDTLVFVRGGKDMLGRRGGFSYIKESFRAKKRFYDLGFISFNNFIQSFGGTLIVSLMPISARKIFYSIFLRK